MTSVNDDEFQRDMAALIPNLRAFARSLARTSDRADDLVQDALVKAWRSRASFEPGSNLKSWLFTILRNGFVSERRRARFQVDDPDGELVASASVPAAQSSHMDMVDFARAVDSLPLDQKEALLLVGAEGFSYEEAAQLCGCAVGTIKSRVNRARSRLTEALGMSENGEPFAVAER